MSLAKTACAEPCCTQPKRLQELTSVPFFGRNSDNQQLTSAIKSSRVFAPERASPLHEGYGRVAGTKKQNFGPWFSRRARFVLELWQQVESRPAHIPRWFLEPHINMLWPMARVRKFAAAKRSLRKAAEAIWRSSSALYISDSFQRLSLPAKSRSHPR